MAHNRRQISDDERPTLAQGFPLGDTGDGITGVPATQQGISNRSGGHASGVAAQEEDGEELVAEEDDVDEDSEDEDEEEDELEDGDSEDEEDE